jgi:hypothetical protein
VPGQGKTVQLLGEILDHVGSLELAVDENVEPDRLLLAEAPLDFLPEGALVVGPAERPRAECRPRSAQLRRLREGSDGRGGQQRQRQSRALVRVPITIARPALVHVGRDGGETSPDLGVPRPGRRMPALEGGPAPREDVTDGRPTLAHRTSEGGHLGELLTTEGQPLAQLWIKAAFALEIDGAVEQRARRRDLDALGAKPLTGSLHHAQGTLEVRAPHVPPVDHAQGERQRRRRLPHGRRKLLGGPYQVEVERADGQVHGGFQVWAQRAEVGRQEDPQPRGQPTEALVGQREDPQHAGRQVQREDRLVDLHPICTGLLQTLQQLAVDRHEALYHVRDALGALPGTGVTRVTQQGQRDRSQEDGPRVNAEGVRLEKLVERLRRGQLEVCLRLQLRDEEVVVGVEPLRHPQWRWVPHAVAGRPRHQRGLPAGHGEVDPQVTRRARIVTESPGHRADDRRHVEHVIIEGEVVRRDVVDAELDLQRPVLTADGAANLSQRRLRDLACPVLLERRLELTVPPDPGKAEIAGSDTLARRHASAPYCCAAGTGIHGSGQLET